MTFQESFAEPCSFEPEGIHISRRAYNRKQAARLIHAYLIDCGWTLNEIPVDPDKLNKRCVRFGPTGFMEADLGKMAWMVCPEGTRAAQPTWQFIAE